MWVKWSARLSAISWSGRQVADKVKALIGRFGFAKSSKAILNAVELRTYKQAAKIVLALTQAQVDTEVREERLFKVNDDAQDL